MKLDKKKNILIINKLDSGGAGTTIYRMFLGLKVLGYNTRLLVESKTKNDVDILQFYENKNNYFRFKFLNKFYNYLKRNSLKKKYGTILDYNYFNFFEDKFDKKVKRFELPNNFIPDIIIGAWISDFFNFESIGELSLKYNAKPYLLMNDMGLLTGGCHYNWSCKGFLKDCYNCPAIIDTKFKNQARLNILERKKNIERYNISIIAGSDLTKLQSKQSFLFQSQSEILIFNGLINFKVFNSSKRRIAKLIFDIPSDAKVIFCGALDFKEKRKGYKQIKDALITLSQMNIPFKSKIFVLMVGNLPENIIIPNLNFKSIDYLNDPVLLSLAYQCSDVFVSPSIEDCGPMMVVESLACGTPVIGFDIGLVSSLISNGENGFKIKNFDTYSMSEKIVEILSFRSNHFNNNCINTVKYKFSLNSLNEMVQKL
jgi:glycosyltransferase involved in cell wall biosynthesis